MGRARRHGRRGAGATTSPEQLVAAAHAGCYSMSLANVLERAGVAVEQLDVQAHCNAGVGGYGLRIEPIDLGVVGVVPGVDADEFTRLAGEAERQCPVSNRLHGNVQIRVDATLRDG